MKPEELSADMDGKFGCAKVSAGVGLFPGLIPGPFKIVIPDLSNADCVIGPILIGDCEVI